jgi:cellulose synthase/poly-beta-1,6-N-acetylglucosamine synthase-like glycosyltransferase
VIITVLIPTYHRTRDLARCLEALEDQTRAPDEILLVVRGTDSETRDLLARRGHGRLPLRTVEVMEPGSGTARNVGLAAAQGEIIAFTDDDSAPRPDWLARIEKHFLADPEVGGVGGRDWIHYGDQVNNGAREIVGKVRWFGRIISNHHLGVGGSREVDILKGVNMSYRRAALHHIRFDERLLAAGGVQPVEDYLFSMEVKCTGWKLIYDPAVAVDHYQAPRFEGHRSFEFEASRESFNFTTVCNRAHNQTLMLLECLSPLRRLVFMLWALLVGSRNAFGLVEWLRFFPHEGRVAWYKLRAALKGRLEGYKTWRGYG